MSDNPGRRVSRPTRNVRRKTAWSAFTRRLPGLFLLVVAVVDGQRAASDDDKVPFPSKCIRRTNRSVSSATGHGAAAMTSTASMRNFTARLKCEMATRFSTSLPPTAAWGKPGICLGGGFLLEGSPGHCMAAVSLPNMVLRRKITKFGAIFC